MKNIKGDFAMSEYEHMSTESLRFLLRSGYYGAYNQKDYSKFVESKQRILLELSRRNAEEKKDMKPKIVEMLVEMHKINPKTTEDVFSRLYCFTGNLVDLQNELYTRLEAMRKVQVEGNDNSQKNE